MRLSSKKHLNIIVTFVIILLVGLVTSCEDNFQGPKINENANLEKPDMISLSMNEVVNGETILVAARNKNAGTVEVRNDLQNIYVNLKTTDGWYLSESHLHMGKTLDQFPLAGRSKNPVPGKFDYSIVHENGATDYLYTIPLDNFKPGDELIIAIHANMEQWLNGKLLKEEGAWASGERFTNRGNWATYFFYTIEETGLMLSNTLASAYEIENSTEGPSGTIIGDANFDHFVKTGQGITPNTGYAGSGVDFPTTIVNAEKGTVEMWAQFYYKPQAYSHGVYGFVNVNHWRVGSSYHNVMLFAWHNSGSQLYFGLKFNGLENGVKLNNFDPPLNTPVHLAVVWDREGIDGTGDYMRIYVGKTMVASNSSINTWGNDNTTGQFRVATPWDSNFSTDRYTVANLKIWDHAKTQF